MTHLSDLSRLLYGKRLHDMQWSFFDREARLIFGDVTPEIPVRVLGIHLVAFRVSLHGPKTTRLCRRTLYEVINRR
jgi:hypothetical protein